MPTEGYITLLCFQRRSTEHTHHSPHIRHPQITPTAMELHFVIETPDALAFVCDRVSAYLPDGFSGIPVPVERIGSADLRRCAVRVNNLYPVAKITTSAANEDPFSNLIPVFVNRSIGLSFFSLIFPSMINWLAPTSVRNALPIQRLLRRGTASSYLT